MVSTRLPRHRGAAHFKIHRYSVHIGWGAQFEQADTPCIGIGESARAKQAIIMVNTSAMEFDRRTVDRDAAMRIKGDDTDTKGCSVRSIVRLPCLSSVSSV